MTPEQIEKNKTKTLKTGDKVVMHSCGEAENYKYKIWTCKTNSFNDNGRELVFLEEFAGCFLVKYLTRVYID